MQRVWNRFFLLGLLTVLLGIALPINPAAAQDGNAAGLRITQVNMESFPQVSFTLDGINLTDELGALPLTVTENGQEVAIDGQNMEDIGTQTALVIDASGSLQDPGLSGKPRYEEVRNVVQKLIEGGKLSSDIDWLGAYAPGSRSGDITTIQAWTTDHQAVWNNLYLYQLPPVGVQTPLFDLIFFGLDSFASSGIQPNLYRSIVLFSDGEVGGSATQLEDAIDRAVREHVVIHTIQMGNDSPGATSNMQRIAILTGGRYIQLTNESDADAVWNTLSGERQQMVLNFRSQAAQPRELGVAATLSNGTVVRTAAAYPELTVSPIAVTLTAPVDDMVLQKDAPAFDTPITDLEPKVLNIQAEFNWPDNRPRTIRQVEYFVGNASQVVSSEPFNQIAFPIDTFESGPYSVRAVATDELGISGTSQPVTVVVDVVRPPQPTPEPPSIAIPNTSVRIPVDRVRTAASLGAVLLAVLALVIAIRKPTVRKQVTEAFTRVVKEVTQPLGLNRGRNTAQAKATLIVMEGDGKLHGQIDLRRANTKIGRSPDQANIVLDDPHVSRYHARITEEPDGTFRIWDEGSTSGTYVNDEPVDLKTGRVLMSGDVVGIGECSFEFRYKTDSDKDRTEPFTQQRAVDLSKDRTEPAIRR